MSALEVLFRRLRPTAVVGAIFLGLLAVYAATTNTRGLYHASLHQGVVQALVEHGTLYIRDYDPRVPLGGDVFIHDGHVYANKQPGSFLLGAAVYWVLRHAGVEYDRDFYLTAALVGLLTSGLLTAATAVLVHRLARRRASAGWALGAGGVVCAEATLAKASTHSAGQSNGLELKIESRSLTLITR